MEKTTLLYDENELFLANRELYPAHKIEIWENVFEQTGHQSRRPQLNKIINGILVFMFFIAVAYAGFYWIFNGLKFLFETQHNLSSIVRTIGVIFVGLLCFYVSYVALKLLIALSIFPSASDAEEAASELIKNHRKAFGRVESIKQLSKRIIHYHYLNQDGLKIEAKFKTRSLVDIKEGQLVIVIHNKYFSALL